jgi:hypothetical protein
MKPVPVKTNVPRKPYIVTNVAPPYMNGARIKSGQTVYLTDRQAMYELDRRTIAPVVVAAKTAKMPVMPPAPGAKV